MQNSLIPDKIDISFRISGLKSATSKENPIGIPHVLTKLSSIFAGTWLLEKNTILSDGIFAICRQYSRRYRMFREYCDDALNFWTWIAY